MRLSMLVAIIGLEVTASYTLYSFEPRSERPNLPPRVNITSSISRRPSSVETRCFNSTSAQFVSQPGVNSSLSLDAIISIAPTSMLCDGSGNWPEECATAAQAATAFNSVFSKYGINNPAAQAAVIAWEVFESAELKLKINHHPGVPGQGTRCMMMPNFVAEYAIQLVGSDQVIAAGGEDQVLALVNNNDQGSFGGGAWFMSNKCPDLIEKFVSFPDAAWSDFMAFCVNTNRTSKRDAYWTSSKRALGV